MTMKYMGVDGCRAGWFTVIIEENEVSCSLYADFSSLWAAHDTAACIMVDIPIGLPDCAPYERHADSLARKRLGGRGASIFTPGVRGVLDAHDYPSACESNRQLTGKKISKQFWNIVPKIKDVDCVVQSFPMCREVVRESHPELCFSLAAGRELIHGKKSSEGIEERLAVIRSLHPNVHTLYEKALSSYYRKDVARDDILDAMILAVTAWTSAGNLRSYPSPPQRDSRSVPMAIWYHEFS